MHEKEKRCNYCNMFYPENSFGIALTQKPKFIDVENVLIAIG